MDSVATTNPRTSFTDHPLELFLPTNTTALVDHTSIDNSNTRAVHTIHKAALRHNYQCVVDAAAQQHCTVMCVVKADGYGHGAAETAQILDQADAFAVATLEEARTIRAVRPQVQLLVLGPPVGVPQCFTTYCHQSIDVMISGPEVARAVLVWIANAQERRRNAVAQAASQTKAEAWNTTLRPQQKKSQSSTLGNVSGQDLANEVRLILQQQQRASVAAAAEQQERLSEKAKSETASRASDISLDAGQFPLPNDPPLPLQNNKRLRWYALIDSGMGRLGFKADDPSTVDILLELVQAEMQADSPIQFCGICTHMAEAMNASYSTSQMDKFTSLLCKVRDAGIHIPTVSTDNSAALLNPNLRHFEHHRPTLLADDGAGLCRIGGALYGQRPAFTQLRPASTVTASVRHVATLQANESVGYDRAYVATRAVRIATLAMGFADGYPRELGNGRGRVAIRGHVYPVVGNVCMDMLMVELRGADENSTQDNGDDQEGVVVVGDTAILWGPSEDGEHLVRLEDLAEQLKTTQSALTCGLDRSRVIRKYV